MVDFNKEKKFIKFSLVSARQETNLDDLFFLYYFRHFILVDYVESFLLFFEFQMKNIRNKKNH